MQISHERELRSMLMLCFPVQTAQATQSIASSMQKTTEVMQSMGKNMTPQEMQKTMQQFAMENQKMDMSSEMIDDAISDALDSDETEGEADDVVSQVLFQLHLHCPQARCMAAIHVLVPLCPLDMAVSLTGHALPS